jgi:hypothetical protein
MKRTDTGDIHILLVEPEDDKQALLAAIRVQKKPVVIILPERARALQRPGDFDDLKRLKHQLNIPLGFVIPRSDSLKQWASRSGFPIYRTVEMFARSLVQEQALRLSHVLHPSSLQQNTSPGTVPSSSPHQGISSPLTPPPESVERSSPRITVPLAPPAGAIHSLHALDAERSRDRAALAHGFQESTRCAPTQRSAVPLASLGTDAFRFPLTSPEPGPSISTKPLPPASATSAEKRRRVLPVLLVLLLLLSGSSVLGTFVYVSSGSHQTTRAPGQPVGQVSFLSSEPLNEISDQGINDEVQIDLHFLPDLAPGKSYYAWLLEDKHQSDGGTILLGALPVSRGNVHFRYTGDRQRTNLLEVFSRFLITEEDANVTPISPSPDYGTWRYYAEIPQEPDPADRKHHFSVLDHLRHLLTSDPVLNARKLPGGLDNWCYRNIRKVLEWTESASDNWGESSNPLLIRQQITRTLDYLDGLLYVHEDVPPDTPILVTPRNAQIGLLNIEGPEQVLPGYLYSMTAHLNGLLQAPGSTSEQRKLAAQVISALSNVQLWLEKVRQDAKQLIQMTDAQLLSAQALSLLDDMSTQANFAYLGRVDPSHRIVRTGSAWIHEHIPILAILDVKRYSAS